jgi:sulfur-carrier protein
MVRVKLPPHLRTLANVTGEVQLDCRGPLTLSSILDEIESRYPMLAGTIRDHNTQQRRPYLRFFVCGEDVSLEPLSFSLPEEVLNGKEPLIVLGAIAGG